MLRTITIAAVLMLIAPIILAEDGAQPRSRPAVTALRKAELAARQAEQVYRQELLRIQRELIRELESAKAQVMRGGTDGSLAEANLIQAAIDAAKAELDRLEGKALTVRVDAGSDWISVGNVRQGEKYKTEVTGRWCADVKQRSRYTFTTSGVVDGTWFGLEGRINDGPTFRLEGGELVIPQSGALRLKLQGNDPRNDDGDVTITFSPSR